MLGSLAGDAVGSVYEQINLKGYTLPLFVPGSGATDDSVMVAATYDAIVNKIPFADCYRKWFWKFRHHGFSPVFENWALDESDPGLSEGNSAAVRGVACGVLSSSKEKALTLAYEAAICSHTSESAKYGQAVALAVFLVKQGVDSNEVVRQIRIDTGLHISTPDLDELHNELKFDSSCPGTVPIAIWMGLFCSSFDDCMRKGIFAGGDVDSILAIAGGIAELRFGVPPEIKEEVLKRTPKEILEQLEITQ